MTDEDKEGIRDPAFLETTSNQINDRSQRNGNRRKVLPSDSQSLILGQLEDSQPFHIELVNIQNENTDMGVVDSLHNSPTSRILLTPKEHTKKYLMKSKPSETVGPKLVLTYLNEDDEEVVRIADDDDSSESTPEMRKKYSSPTSNSKGVFNPHETKSSFRVDHSLENCDNNSDRSFQNGRLNIQQHFDRMETASMRSYRSFPKNLNNDETEETRKEKRQRFWDFFTMISSISYALFLIILGMFCYGMDLFLQDHNHYSEKWNLFLCCFGIIWLLWLIFDINRYIRMINQHCSDDINGLKLVEGEDGEYQIEISMAKEKKKIPKYYGFSTGRHSGSFFLKIGAGIFCFGHLIHMGLIFIRKIIVYSDKTNPDPNEQMAMVSDCVGGEVVLLHDVLYPVFSFLQLFVIYKFGNVIVNKNKALARFAFMHCIGASLCFWIYTIKNETLDSLNKKYFDKEIKKCFKKKYSCKLIDRIYDDDNDGIKSEEDNDSSSSEDSDDECEHDKGDSGNIWNISSCTAENQNGPLFQSLVETQLWCSEKNLTSTEGFSFSDWFYPFSIEFSILVVGIWYIMWTHIGNINQHQRTMEFLPEDSMAKDGLNASGHKDAMVLYADCSRSTKGMFLGLILLVSTVLGCIVVVILDEYMANYLVAALAVESTIFLVMIIACVTLYIKIVCLDVNPNPISQLDDMLLIVCLPSFFLFSILQFVAALRDCDSPWCKAKALDILKVCFYLIQVLIQTPLIIDGLRRCSNSLAFQQRKVGRNTLMFLIVANLAVYIMDTILLKGNIYKREETVYTPLWWTILSHIALPLCIFYRFHSAVALADIWSSAYSPAEHH